VGERSGTGRLYDDSLLPRANVRAVDVTYVDLARELAGVSRIDLLKCDVEGAELRVLECWPEVLRKTRVAVFELHAHWCDTDRCRQLLAEQGFDEHAVLRAGDPCSTYAVWRKR
jgi:hypothetical protein